jgi:hypothetical protein
MMSETRSGERRWLVSSACGLLLSTSLPRAQAEPAAAAEGVRVELPSCAQAPYDDAELRRTLALELRQRGLEPEPHEPPAQVARLELPDCDAAHAALRLELVAARSGAVSRDVDLDEVPYEARARVLALLIAESLQAPGAAPTLPPDPPLADDGAGTLAGSNAPPARESPANVRVGLAASGRSLIDVGELFWGVEANGVLRVWGPLRAALELGWTRGEVPTALGPFDATWWTAALGGDVEYQGMMEVAIGPRLSLAHLSSRGDPRPGAISLDPSATLVLLGARAGAAFPLGGGFRLVLSLDAAHALNGVVLQAGGLPALSLDGWLLNPGVGVALEL